MATQSTDPNKPGYVPKSILGYDPKIAYNDYVAAVAQQNASYSGGHDITQGALPFNDWFSSQAQNAGTYGLSNLLQMTYANSMGSEMPQAQLSQAMRIINSLPPTTQQQILVAGGIDTLSGTGVSGSGSRVAALLKEIGPLQNFLYSATGGDQGKAPVLTPAQLAQQSAENSARSTYLGIFGHMPSETQVKQMAGMNQSDVQNYINNQQYKLGLTYGQWSVASGNINKQYMQYFGRNADDNEIAWANGKSVDDIQAHIMDSPSRVDGLKMGQYMNYKNVLDGISTDTFGYSAPDEMIKMFHDSQGQK